MSELHQEIKDQVQKFRTQFIDPIIEEDDEKEVFRLEIFQKLGELGSQELQQVSNITERGSVTPIFVFFLKSYQNLLYLMQHRFCV